MKTLTLLVVLLSLSCGPSADIVSKHNVSFYLNEANWTKLQVDLQEDWMIEQLGNLGVAYRREDVEKSMRKTVVFVYDSPIPCYAGLCNGMQNGTKLHVVDRGCPAVSAYTHELMHWLQEDIRGYVDYDHKEIGVWQIADGAPSRSCP